MKKQSEASLRGKRSRRKGQDWEREIVRRLKDIGYTGCKSARSESKSMDDNKIDVVDVDGKLPCYIQAKCTEASPSYHKIESECPLKDRPFVIAWKKPRHAPVAIVPMEFFYTLLEKTR